MLKTKNSFARQKNEKSHGQGFIELALVFPILIILLSGVVEFGFMMNEYTALISAARNTARFGSDGQYNQVDSDYVCKTTQHFYRQLGCLVNQELRQEKPFVALNDNNTPDVIDDYLDPTRGDDIVISVFSLIQGPPASISQRYPNSDGWSYALDLQSYASRNHSSEYSNADVISSLDAGAPSSGLLLVEIFYSYEQYLKLPWITAFMPELVPLHVYTFMPLSSAEPTPTPEP